MIRPTRLGSALLLLALAAAPTGAALAHGSMKPQHGGVVAEAGETVVELVREGDGVALYLSQDDEPVPSAGYSGSLAVAAGEAKAEATLQPGQGNRMEAKGLKLPSGSEATLRLVDPVTQSRSFATFAIK
ncbi:MAG TPA: hypothetical protein VEB20_13715 [Azospirillaceae bacterium]|nr:hypothetical protein [Azospirillaceae bacterium]